MVNLQAMECDDHERVLLSLKTKKLAYFCEQKDERVCQQDQYVDQREDYGKFHVAPPNQTSYRQLSLFHSTITKDESQQM
jgi:hypothetical protein